MFLLTENEALRAVRANLDEIAPEQTQMFNTLSSTNAEERSLDATILRTLPHAINFINGNVPAYLLEGVDATLERESGETGTVFTFSIDENDFEVMRLVSVRAQDSNNKAYGKVLTESVAEYSPEGHMQHNPYTRGTWDNPVLVRKQGERQKYVYYSLKESSDSLIGKVMLVCQYHDGELWQAATANTEAGYSISASLRDSIINQLTGMVLAIYNLTDKSKYYFELARNI